MWDKERTQDDLNVFGKSNNKYGAPSFEIDNIEGVYFERNIRLIFDN